MAVSSSGGIVAISSSFVAHQFICGHRGNLSWQFCNTNSPSEV